MRVRGDVRVASGEGMSVEVQSVMRARKRRGRTRKGRRMRRASSVERQIVPNNVVVACAKAACITWREVGAGTVKR